MFSAGLAAMIGSIEADIRKHAPLRILREDVQEALEMHAADLSRAAK